MLNVYNAVWGWPCGWYRLGFLSTRIWLGDIYCAVSLSQEIGSSMICVCARARWLSQLSPRPSILHRVDQSPMDGESLCFGQFSLKSIMRYIAWWHPLIKAWTACWVLLLPLDKLPLYVFASVNGFQWIPINKLHLCNRPTSLSPAD